MNSFKKLFCPIKKPHKLYFQYIGWSFTSNVLVSIESVLASHSVLVSIDSYDSQWMKTANYIGKDIIGQCGGLFVMAKISRGADSNPKKFLLYSNICQQLSYTLICFTPFFDPVYFLPVAGIANLMANVAFVGYGATNAKVIDKLSMGNIGEIYAKITILSTLGSSVGMLLGLCITTIVPDHNIRLCFIPVLGAARIYTFNKGIKNLVDMKKE